MKFKIWILVIVLALQGAALVNAQPMVGFTEGEIAFDYSQTPFGPYSGSFQAIGPAGGAGDFIDPGETEGCGGVAGSSIDGHLFLGYGAIRNPDKSLDLVILMIFTDSEPITPGTYSIDVTDFSSFFWYLDDVEGIVMPDNLDDANWDDLVASLIAAHKFASISGSITIDQLDASSASGTFTGAMIDLDDIMTLISVSNGAFQLTGGYVASDDASFSELKTMYR